MDRLQTEGHMCLALSGGGGGGNAQVQAFKNVKKLLGMLSGQFLYKGVSGLETTQPVNVPYVWDQRDTDAYTPSHALTPSLSTLTRVFQLVLHLFQPPNHLSHCSFLLFHFASVNQLHKGILKSNSIVIYTAMLTASSALNVQGGSGYTDLPLAYYVSVSI